MAYGDITYPVIDAWILDTENSHKEAPIVCPVKGNIYAVVTFNQTHLRYELHTFSCSTVGLFTKTLIDTYVLSTSGWTYPLTIAKRASGVFIVTYREYPSTLVIETIAIADDGTIGAVIDTETINGFDGSVQQGAFLNVTGNIWALPTYEGWGTTPNYYRGLRIRTFTITMAGAISAVIDTLTIQTYTGAGSLPTAETLNFHFFKIGNGYFGVVFAGGGELYDTTLKTFTISDAGVFSAIIDTETVQTYQGIGAPVAFNVSGYIWAIVYKKSTDGTSEVSTYTISSVGAISSVIDTYNFDTVSSVGHYKDVKQTDVHKWTIFYTRNYYLYVATLTIADNGTITDSVQVPSQALASQCTPGNVIYLSGDYFLVASTTSFKAYLATVKVSTLRNVGYVWII